MSIKKFALDKALAFLRASGADFVVIFEGETFQSAHPTPEPSPAVADPGPEPEGPKKRAPRKRLHRFDRDTDYLPRIEKMTTGDVEVFERANYKVLETDVAWTNFCCSVASKARQVFGPGDAYIFRKEERKCELLRTS